MTESPGYEPLARSVAESIRRGILDGRYAPGTAVRQETVARELGVSRIPVREALRALENEGLVVTRPHSGARVVVLDFAECLEAYKIRERLEPLAFGESAGNLTDAQLAAVTALARELEPLQADQGAWLEGDRRFHLACYAGIATPRLLRMIVEFWNTTQHYRRLLLTTFTEQDFALAHAEHELMVDALASGNGRSGEEIVRVAMERSRLRLARHARLFDR